MVSPRVHETARPPKPRPAGIGTIDRGERHWHGATEARAMIMVAARESVDGSSAQWHELVDDVGAGGR